MGTSVEAGACRYTAKVAHPRPGGIYLHCHCTHNGTIVLAPILVQRCAGRLHLSVFAFRYCLSLLAPLGVLGTDGITATYTTAATGTGIGTFPITPVLLDPNNRLSNYNLTSNNGTLTVHTPLWVSVMAITDIRFLPPLPRTAPAPLSSAAPSQLSSGSAMRSAIPSALPMQRRVGGCCLLPDRHH